jgi:hypothetical protein
MIRKDWTNKKTENINETEKQRNTTGDKYGQKKGK